MALYFPCGKTSGPKATRDYSPAPSALHGSQRLNLLNTPLSPVFGVAPERMDTLEKITMELYNVYKGTFVSVDVINKQFKLLKLISEQAKTGSEFYALNLVTTKDPIYSGLGYLQQAAALGHVLALREVVSRTFAGHFSPLEESIRWGLKCLRYLEETVVPNLEKEDSHSEILNTLKDGLARLRERRREVLPTIITRDPKAFDKLVNDVVEYRKLRVGEILGDFIIAQDMIEKLEESLPPLLPIDEPKDHLLEERQLLLQVLVTLTDKVDELQSNPNHNIKATAVAKRLNVQLAEAINIYITKKSIPTLNTDQIELAKLVFLDTCTKVINNAKPLLEKELGWGDFITNLLKSLANVMICATNAVTRTFGAKSQFTLFKPTPAPLVPEVEQVEKALRSSIPSP